jgi:NAD(P)-dependent dehydrogenase (short-subunit alcohol dehydrogenase family)
MSKTIAVFGVGPGMGRSVARRFGQEGFEVALVARNQTRLDAFTRELAADGIETAGFAGDLADAIWDLCLKRDTFDQVFGLTVA